ncbi:MAG: YbaK/EbsC family protein, partial [Candidatus Nanoarchaeia archaeon]
IAAIQHTPGDKLIKSVIVKFNGKTYYMLGLPATYKIDFKKLKAASGAKTIELAKEEELKTLFPDCEIGALPPFGNLYNIPVVIDKSAENNDEIVFSAGNHKETVKMKYVDYKKLVKPKLADFAIHV